MPNRHIDAAEAMVAIAQKHGCGGIVVGLPVKRAGLLRDPDTDSQVGRRCRNFAITLALVCRKYPPLLVFIVDEAYTTRDADEAMDLGSRSSKFKQVRQAVIPLCTMHLSGHPEICLFSS